MPREDSRFEPPMVCVAAVVAPHGVHGRVKIKVFTEDIDALSRFDHFYDAQGNPIVLQVTGIKENKGLVYAQIDGINTREKADALREKEIFVKREDLPPLEEGEFYYEDLAGLEVRDTAGRMLGSIKTMHNYGAGDIMEIILEDERGKRSEMLSFTNETVPEVHVAAGYVVVCMPEEIVVRREE